MPFLSPSKRQSRKIQNSHSEGRSWSGGLGIRTRYPPASAKATREIDAIT